LISSTTLFGYRAGSTAGNLFFFVVQKTQISTKIQIIDVKNDKNKVLQIKYEHLAAAEVTITSIEKSIIFAVLLTLSPLMGRLLTQESTLKKVTSFKIVCRVWIHKTSYKNS
jgi:hypothetical protein